MRGDVLPTKIELMLWKSWGGRMLKCMEPLVDLTTHMAENSLSSYWQKLLKSADTSKDLCLCGITEAEAWYFETCLPVGQRSYLAEWDGLGIPSWEVNHFSYCSFIPWVCVSMRGCNDTDLNSLRKGRKRILWCICLLVLVITFSYLFQVNIII